MNEQTDSNEILSDAFNSVICFIRETHPEEIDDAYEFFWEEEEPEDILGGTALGIAFINFEDWLVCDHRRKDDGEGYIDIFIRERKPEERTASVLAALRDSVLSVYKVKAAGPESCTLEDVLFGGKVTLTGASIPKLREGDVFGGRIFQWEGRTLMGRAVYPFNTKVLDRMSLFFDKELKRYTKKNPGATVREMLKDEGYFMNVVWLNCLYTRSA